MLLEDTDIKRLAKLARIALTEAEIAAAGIKLNSLFGLIEQLKAVDTEGVAPMSHARDVSLRLREDAVSETDLRDRFQAVAPAVENHLYIVPKVIE